MALASANLREGAGVTFKVITKVPKGTKLELIEEGGTGRDRWFRVKLASGQVGWIAASAVTED